MFIKLERIHPIFNHIVFISMYWTNIDDNDKEIFSIKYIINTNMAQRTDLRGPITVYGLSHILPQSTHSSYPPEFQLTHATDMIIETTSNLYPNN